LLSSTTGTVDATWDLNIGGSGAVNAMLSDGTYLYVGGLFTSVNGGTARNNICRSLLSSTTGTVDASWNMNCSDSVTGLASDSTYLYVGGKFISVNNNTIRKGLCRVSLSSSTGTLTDSFGGGVAIISTAVVVFTDTSKNIYISGITIITVDFVATNTGLVIYNPNITIQTHSGTQYINDTQTSTPLAAAITTKTFTTAGANKWLMLRNGGYRDFI
jgi:hypothetical protein